MCMGAVGPWPPLGEAGLGRVRLAVPHLGVAGLSVGAVLGALPALCCSRGGPWRLARRGALARAPVAYRRLRRGRLERRLRPRAACLAACPGPLLRGGAAGPTAWAAGAASLAASGLRAGSSGSLGAAQGCSAGGPTGTAASASRRSFCSAGSSPVHPGETGERKRDRQWWQLSRWGEPLESDNAASLAGVRGCRCACPSI